MSFENIVTNTLTELLRSFQSAIAPLLELGKIEDWDGTELKKREEKIRELVIICIFSKSQGSLAAKT